MFCSLTSQIVGWRKGEKIWEEVHFMCLVECRQGLWALAFHVRKESFLNSCWLSSLETVRQACKVSSTGWTVPVLPPHLLFTNIPLCMLFFYLCIGGTLALLSICLFLVHSFCFTSGKWGCGYLKKPDSRRTLLMDLKLDYILKIHEDFQWKIH